MKQSSFGHQVRNGRKPFVAVVAVLAAFATFAGGAYSHDTWEPVTIAIEGAVVPGQTVDCRVEMTGGPEHVTIYSNPPGIAYSGTLDGATDTVSIPVSPGLNAEQVTVYVQSDGNQVVSTTVDTEPSPGFGVQQAGR